MNRRFWLPCSCGKRFAIDASQAGESIACSCGRSIEVPPLRRLVHLEKLPEDGGEPIAKIWGWRQRLMLLGGAILIVAAIAVVCVLATWPRPPWSRVDWQTVHKEVAAMSPWKAHQLWVSLLRPLDTQITPEQAAEFERAVQRQQGLMVLAGLLGVVGLGAMVASRFIPPARPSP